MSKKSTRKQSGINARKAAKAAKMAKYAKFAEEGRLKGSRRAKRAGKANPASKHAHLVSNCGNPGCERCFPSFAKRRNPNTCTSQQVAA